MDETKTINGTPILLINTNERGWLFVEVIRDSGRNYKVFAKPEDVIRPIPCSDKFKDLSFSGEQT